MRTVVVDERAAAELLRVSGAHPNLTVHASQLHPRFARGRNRRRFRHLDHTPAHNGEPAVIGV